MSPTACLTDIDVPSPAAGNGRSPASARKRPIVVVLGMHRSGTSLLANLLTALGVDLGGNLLPADANNQAGYWEQQEIYHTQDALLEQLSGNWPGFAWT